jgi:hypothetical protein
MVAAQRDRFDELVRENLAAVAAGGHPSLQPSKSNKALIDDSMATKINVSTRLTAVSRLNRSATSRTLSASSFRDESGSPRSALHGGVSARHASASPEDDLPDEPTLRDKLRELELEFPPLKCEHEPHEQPHPPLISDTCTRTHGARAWSCVSS